MFYTNTATPTSPTDVSLREFALTSATTLAWSFAGVDTVNTMARIMILTSTNGSALLMPPANQGPQGYSTMIVNLGASTVPVQDNTGGAIDTVAAGQIKIITLRAGSTTAAGIWLSSTLGATTSTANSVALAGLGLKSIAQTLNADFPATSFSATQSFGVGTRGSFYVWTGGAGAANFSLSSTLTNGWWMAFRNAGSGALVLTPTAPDLIDSASTQTLNPGDACLVFSTGAALFTVGIGRNVTITDTQLTKNVAGNVDVTLTPSEYANNIINLTGALTGNINVIFPTAIKNYFIRNNTSGAFTLKCKTSAGTGVFIPQGGASIITSDGTNVDASNTSSAGTVTSIVAGTGLNGGTITGSGTISLANTAVTPGTYGDSSHFVALTVDAQGRVTAASQNGYGAFSANSISPLSNTIPACGMYLNTANQIGFSGQNALQVLIQSVASTVNYIVLTGAATANNLGIVGAGTDTDIGLSIVSKGVGNLDFCSQQTSNNINFRIAAGSAPTNYIFVSGANTGSNPNMGLLGADTNIGLNLLCKGTGAFTVCSNSTGNNPNFRVFNTNNSVNYVYAQGGATGNAVQFGTIGADGDVGLNISSCGSGSIQFKTANQSLRQVEIDHAAAAVNYLILQGASTGNSVPVTAWGSDANVDLSLLVKGSGRIIAPAINANTTASAANVNVDGSGILRKSTSSLRYKTNVRDYETGLAAALKMRPVLYNSKVEADGDRDFTGFIAEEIDALGLQEYVAYQDNKPDQIFYGNITALLINCVKELNDKITRLENA